MGQTYSTGVNDRNLAISEIPGLQDVFPEKPLGLTRFLKTVKAKHGDGHVVLRQFVKPTTPNSTIPRLVRRVRDESDGLANIPNVLPYQRVVDTDRAVFLVRQYLYSTLYDRISTRPFLEQIEKRWISFQLLCGLRECHARGIRHGDIKTENVLVTSWNWVYLSDFAPFKPTYLPEDNPADFSFFFETSNRRICYLAPERFLGPGEQNSGGLTDAMDIFSLGCVIAELFFEGSLFTLSQLFKYRKGDYDPSHILEKIEDLDMRELVKHMIQVDPKKRLSAEEYLNQWRRKAFPDYFYSFLHQYVDGIINKMPQRADGHVGEADHRIDRIYYEFDKISFFLGYKDDPLEPRGNRAEHRESLPVHLDIPNYERNMPAVRRRETTANDGTLIFLSIIASALRNTHRATVRVHACDLLLAFAERIPDESKLDRVLPYFMSLIDDEAPIVRVAAIRGLAQLMEIVEVLSRPDAQVFPEYILPRLQKAPYDSNPLVRATYASCLASLADSSARFLELAQALKPLNQPTNGDPDDTDDGKPAFHSLYDSSKGELMLHFSEHAKALLTDGNSSVRRAFLRSVARLCIFFGSAKANDIILSHLNTYLNDKDWILRCGFFETIISVATFVGGTNAEEYIMPLMVQALTDPEEFVIEKVIHSLTAMAGLGLFSRTKIWELVDVVARFSIHPNLWVRESTAAFIVASAKWLSPVDINCILIPLLRPYLRCSIAEVSVITLLSYFKKPLSRGVFDMSVTWATKTERGIFWKSSKDQRAFSFGSGFENYSLLTVTEDRSKSSFRIPKNDEDEQWLTKLRNLGMTAEDEWKLFALREYIWRMAKIKQRHSPDIPSTMNKIITLKDSGLNPQTVFFEDDGTGMGLEQAVKTDLKTTGSLAEALIDASKTIDEPLRRTGSRSTLRPPGENGLARRSSSLDTRPITPIAIPAVTSLLNPDRRPSNASDTTAHMPPPNRVSSVASSVVSDAASEMKRRMLQRTLSHKSSAAALMNKGGSTKAAAEVSTDSANARGHVELPFARDGRTETTTEESADGGRTGSRALHTYRGNDPYILKLLNSHCLENFPSEILDFGPIIVNASRKQSIKQIGGRSIERAWRPEGVMVAHFGEHTAAINRVVVAPDHAFFVTASDDGTVKVWDAGRLEKNVATRARQTYRHAMGVKIRSLCFVENTHCFVSAGNDGSIHVVKVEYTQTSVASKYGKLKKVRQTQLKEGEYALWMDHFKYENHSILLIATNHCRIIAIELRNMSILYTLQNPEHHGTPTCFVVDRKRAWVLLGTVHGVVDLWDLRFRLRLKSWGLPGATEIHKLILHPTKGRGKWVVIAGGTGHGEISTWDVEKGVCREVYRASSGKDSGKGYEPWKVDDEKSEGILGRFASTPSHLVEPTASPAMDRGVRALAVGVDSPEDSRDSRNQNGFIITGGSDRKIHFWNLPQIENSVLVSGHDSDLPRPLFSTTQFSTSLTINIERIPQNSDTPTGGNGRSGTPPNGAAMRRTRTTQRPPRTTVISQQQQELLRSHLDSILDVALLEVPYGMIVSVDRSGVIFVFR